MPKNRFRKRFGRFSDDAFACDCKNKITAQMPNIALSCNFYPFIGFQNPKLAAPAEEGFNWIMDSDNTKAVYNLTKVLGQAKSQIGDNVQTKMMIVQMLKKGLERKMKLFRESFKHQSKYTNRNVE